MGWASGHIMADEIWRDIKKYIPKKKQQEVAIKIIEVFNDNDCDTMQESELYLIAFPDQDEYNEGEELNG